MELLFIWLVFSGGIAYAASARGRSGVGFFFLSLLLSPLLGLIVLLLIPNLAQADSVTALRAREEEQKQEATRREHERHLESLKALTASKTVQVPSVTATSTADELAKLAQLRDRGILTEDEFRTQKETLLRRSQG